MFSVAGNLIGVSILRADDLSAVLCSNRYVIMNETTAYNRNEVDKYGGWRVSRITAHLELED